MKSPNLTRILTTAVILAPVVVLAGVLKMTSAGIRPFPNEDQEVQLKGLVYDGETKEITSVHYELASEEGADPVRADWIFTGRNSRGHPQRVNLSCILNDADDRRIAVARKTIVLKAGAKEQKDTLKMKVKSKVWKAAKKATILAEFASFR